MSFPEKETKPAGNTSSAPHNRSSFFSLSVLGSFHLFSGPLFTSFFLLQVIQGFPWMATAVESFALGFPVGLANGSLEKDWLWWAPGGCVALSYLQGPALLRSWAFISLHRFSQLLWACAREESLTTPS